VVSSKFISNFLICFIFTDVCVSTFLNLVQEG
jgi:hypothetical protein